MAKNGKVSKFAQSAAAATVDEDRGEQFDFGRWRVTLKGCTEADNGSFCFSFAGAGKDRKIGDRIQWFSTSGKARFMAEKAVKRLCMILAGFDSDDEYTQWDGASDFVDAIVRGELGEAAEVLVSNGRAKNAKKALAALEATEFTIIVSKGGERDDGDFFRNGRFAPVADDVDDSEDEDDEPESKPAPRRKVESRDEDDAEDEEEDSDSEDEDDAPPPRKGKR